MESSYWAGKTAVVTGAGGGIGLAIAERFGAAAMAVVLADRDSDRLVSATERVRAAGSKTVLAVECDVTSISSVEDLARQVGDTFGDVHVLCNNAGVLRPGRTWEATPDDWSALLGVNVLGIANGVRAFVPGMLAHGQPGHVVNTASMAGLFSAPSFAAYAVSKAAAVALSEVLALEVSEVPGSRLRVSVLCPGGVSTNLYADEIARRSPNEELSDLTAGRWSSFADTGRTDRLSPPAVAEHVWAALEDGRFWILPTQSGMLEAARSRIHDIEIALAATVAEE